ncbi:MAG: hypothetical protein ABL878_07735 [Burkholderiales bacterium]
MASLVLLSSMMKFAYAVDLPGLTVQSRQGQALRAEAGLSALPEEKITTACLALGSAADAPYADYPVLDQATLRLDPTGTKIEIRGATPIHSPGLEIVLRVQCPDAALYAKIFRVLIPPATQAAPSKRRGYRLRIAQGETLEDIARMLLPKQYELRESLIRQTIAGNPAAFPEGKERDVAAGTVLWFPDLRDVNSGASRTQVAQPRLSKPKTKRVEARPVRPAVAKSAGNRIPAEPINLRRALKLGEQPGPAECRTLAKLCGTDSAVLVSLPKNLPAGAHRDIVPLLRQEGFDAQILRLEQSLAILANSIATTSPSRAPESMSALPTTTQSPPPVVPHPWVNWLVAALIALIAAAAGFGLGRRKVRPERREPFVVPPVDEKLNLMLVTAADAMRDFENTRDPSRAGRRRSDATTPWAPLTDVLDAAAPAATGLSATAPAPAGMAPIVFTAAESLRDILATQPVNAPRVERIDTATNEIGLSGEESFEIDQAMDGSGALLDDVDRFIATGDFQNAITLLQYRVQQEPLNRSAWIKLLGVYRKAKMDADLDATIREFRTYFPRNTSTD